MSIREHALSQMMHVIQQYSANMWGYLLDFGATTLTTLIYGLTTLVLVFYCLLDGEQIKRGLVRLLPHSWHTPSTEFLDEIHAVCENFVKTQVLLAFLAGGYMWLVYELLGIKYAAFLSVLYAVASIVPVIGPWFGILPALLMLAFGENPISLVHLLLFSSLFYFLKEYWWMPRLFQNRFEIHPVIIILTFLAGLQIAHVPGILLALPVASFICATFQYCIERQERHPQ